MRISDWSSDVCSSDLIGNDPSANASGVGLGAFDVVVSRNVFTDLAGGAIVAGGVRRDAPPPSDPRMTNRQLSIVNNLTRSVSKDYSDNSSIIHLGSASCRDRVSQYL